nr:hypothetical protein [Sedimentibacter sp.]
MYKAKVFMIMRFEEEFFEVFEMLKRQFGDDFEFTHAGEEGNQQNILKDIIQPIYESDIIIADLTGLNPNVLYELGLAHSFNKKTIIITKDNLSTLPFDLKQYRAKDYETHFLKFDELLKYLEKNLNGAVTGDVIYSNPVKDFLASNKIDTYNWFTEDKIQIDIEDDEKGFLDFLAEIETDTSRLTDNIGEIVIEMTSMNDDVARSTKEIERVKNIGGNSIAAFNKKEAKKVASSVKRFSDSLKIHNQTYSELWDKIERNILGLLENKYSADENNKDGLIDYLKALKSTQYNADESKDSILSFKDSLNENIGIERTLNQAIRLLNIDLETYITVVSQMSSSIDRILDKSRFVVGNIDFSENIEEKVE